jgi:hypothetical protein
MNIPWEIKRYIDAQKPNMVNFSATSKRTEMISSNRIDIYVDSFTKDVIFETVEAGVKKQLRFNVGDGQIKNVQTIFFKYNTNLTGVSNGSTAFEADSVITDSIV